MSKAELCDLCGQKIMERWEDVSYKFIVKKRWFSYSGAADDIYREKKTLDICSTCMGKIIKVTTGAGEDE